jgi:serine/threonine protein kinase
MESKDASKTCPYCGLPAGAGPESALHLPPGTILQDKYLLGRALGQGGFGITYLAWDLTLNLKLAIKEYLPLDMASRASGQTEISVYKKEHAGSFQYGLEKYLEEARTLARFAGHPSIVWVRDFFKANGTAYIVMEYVEGVTLKEYLQDKQEPLPLEQALTIFMPVLDALKEVHAEGILHRDISPDNLLISNRGRVVLIDFGAARQAVGEQSRSLSVIMKPGFSPEEQYHSRGKQGPWTDIYAVAASLYCTITSTTPPESLSRLSEDTLENPSTLGVRIDPILEKALLKAMAVRAEDRYQTVKAFQSELVAYSGTNKTCEDYAIIRSKKKGKKPKQTEKVAIQSLQVVSFNSTSKKAVKTIVLLIACGLLLFGSISLFGSNKETTDLVSSEVEETVQSVVGLKDEAAAQGEIEQEDSVDESRQNYELADIAGLDADYYIDYEYGTIPMHDLSIGTRVVDPTWEWEFRIGDDYTRGTGDNTKPVTWIVVAQDHYNGLDSHVTLLSEELIGKDSFSASNRNHWGESSLRKWLNYDGFYQAFSASFINAVLSTELPNKEWQNGSAYSTTDHVFIPSTTELWDTAHRYTYLIGSAYPYFQGEDNTKRISVLGVDNMFYWTRSPGSGDGGHVCGVSSGGDFNLSYFAYYSGDGIRPALNLKSDTLVSEIRD